MIFSNETRYLFGCLDELSEPEKGVVPSYLEDKYKLIGAIENIREKGCDLYEMAGLLRCLSSNDEEEVREVALRAICENSDNIELKKIALIISSFDPHEDVLTTMLEESNGLDVDFAKELASRFINHEDVSVSVSVSEYANGILKR